MKSMWRQVGALVLGSAVFFTAPAPGHEPDEAAGFEVPTTNPRAVVRQRVAATEFEVSYSRPSVRGREIFGGLVPYGKVWRTGADAATRFSASTAFEFGGVPLAAGSYELFTVPGAEGWEVMLQRGQGQWGSYAYDPANDVARVAAVPARLHDRAENFTIGFEEVTGDGASLTLAWDRVRVPVRLTVDLRATVVPELERALAAEGRRPYFLAAMFYFENDLDIERAAELMELALEGNPGHIGMLHRQALILERKGDLEGAMAAARSSLAGAAAAGSELREEYTRLNTALLARLEAKARGAGRPTPGDSGV